MSSRSNASASRRLRSRAVVRRAAGLAVLLLVLGGATGAAEAKKKLVVLDFKGPRAAKVQRAVVKLLKPSATLVGDKAFLQAAREVDGYSPDASGVSKVALRLKVHGVLTGKVQKRGSRYKLTVQLLEGKSGEVVGGAIVVALKRGRIDTAGRRKLAREIRAAMADLPEPVADEPEPVALPELPELPPAGATTPAEGPGNPTATAGATGTAGTSKTSGTAKVTARPAPPAKRRARATTRKPARGRRVASADVRAGGGGGGGDEESAITREAPEPEADPRERAIDLVAGASFVARKLSFDYSSALAGPQQPQGYDGALVPGVYADAELYPVTLADRGGKSFARGIGVSAMIDKVLLIKSKLENGGDEALPTAQTRWGVGLVYRWNFGSRPTSPSLVVGARYNQLSFSIDESEAPDPAAIQIPDVSYTYVDPGLRFRLPVGQRLAFRLEGHYLVVLDAGQIQEPDRYGEAGVIAFDADVGAELSITSNIMARVGGRFAQYGLSFNGDGDQTDPTEDGTQDVDSATDRYLGFYATAGVVF